MLDNLRAQNPRLVERMEAELPTLLKSTLSSDTQSLAGSGVGVSAATKPPSPS